MSRKRNWEQEYADGRFDFLDQPHEQLRHAVISCLISRHAPGEVIDLGCGGGQQLGWLRCEDVTRYTGVDVSPTALSGMPQSSIPTETVVSSIEDYHAPARHIGAIICAEALYFLEDPVGALQRIAGETASTRAIIVSLVVPTEKKPNWRRDVEAVWDAFENSGLLLIDKVRVGSSAAQISWDVALYRVTGIT